jgi:hypothetical protein
VAIPFIGIDFGVYPLETIGALIPLTPGRVSAHSDGEKRVGSGAEDHPH